jgi:cytochrome c oxidase assembly protein subunit 19
MDLDGSCAKILAEYKDCITLQKGRNADPCRALSKAYLQCRMDHNLMVKDDFKNLGFRDLEQSPKEHSTQK